MKESKSSVPLSKVTAKPPAKATGVGKIITKGIKKPEEPQSEPLSISYDHFVIKPQKNPNDWLKEELSTTSTKASHKPANKNEAPSNAINVFTLKAKSLKLRGHLEQRRKQMSAMVDEFDTAVDHQINGQVSENNNRSQGGLESVIDRLQLTQEEMTFLQQEEVRGRGSMPKSHKFYTTGLMAMPMLKTERSDDVSHGILCSRCSRMISEAELSAMQSSKISASRSFNTQMQMEREETTEDNDEAKLQPSVWGAKPLSEDSDEVDLVFAKDSKGWTCGKNENDSDSESY